MKPEVAQVMRKLAHHVLQGTSGVMGLTRAFLAAGARSVLASLWAVDDAAAYYFMRSF